jgi:ketosteroid isomerase-like protein
VSQENLEIVRRGSAAFNRGDYVGFAENLHPDVEFRDFAHAADAQETIKGVQALLSLLSEWRDSFVDFQADIRECIDTGDHVVCVTRWTGRGKASDAVVDTLQVDVYELHEGKIVRATLGYPDKAKALEALGPSEWENAEQRGLAEAGFAALNSGDLEAFLALTAEDAEFTSMVAEAEGTTFRGHDGVRAWWETVRGVFDDVRWDLLDIRGSGDRGVLHFRMTGTLGSVPVEQTMWQAVALRDGKAIWWAFFRSEREALEAVGLAE